MPLKTSHDDDLPAINLTPMLDIVFNLIIFFMVGARFVEAERKIDVKVPQVKNSENLAAVLNKRMVNVYHDGRITLDKQELTLDQLVAQLGTDRRQNTDMSITLRGDGDSSFQNVASVLTACRKAGIEDISISVRPQGTKKR